MPMGSANLLLILSCWTAVGSEVPGSSCSVTLFSNPDFSGASATLAPGGHELAQWAGLDNQVSSLRVRGGCSVWLWQNPLPFAAGNTGLRLGGPNQFNLQTYHDGEWDNVASSVTVRAVPGAASSIAAGARSTTTPADQKPALALSAAVPSPTPLAWASGEYMLGGPGEASCPVGYEHIVGPHHCKLAAQSLGLERCAAAERPGAADPVGCFLVSASCASFNAGIPDSDGVEPVRPTDVRPTDRHVCARGAQSSAASGAGALALVNAMQDGTKISLAPGADRGGAYTRQPISSISFRAVEDLIDARVALGGGPLPDDGEISAALAGSSGPYHVAVRFRKDGKVHLPGMEGQVVDYVATDVLTLELEGSQVFLYKNGVRLGVAWEGGGQSPTFASIWLTSGGGSLHLVGLEHSQVAAATTTAEPRRRLRASRA